MSCEAPEEPKSKALNVIRKLGCFSKFLLLAKEFFKQDNLNIELFY
jgi:hypothetical protein